MDVRALSQAPGARRATGADIMQESRNRQAVNTRRDTFEGRSGPAPGAAPGLHVAREDRRAVAESAVQKTGLLASIKGWLKDRKQKKIDAAREQAENARIRTELAQKVATQEQEIKAKKVEQELARMKQFYRTNTGQPAQQAPQKAPMTAPPRNPEQAKQDGAKIAQNQGNRPQPQRPGQLPQARTPQPAQQPQKPPKDKPQGAKPPQKAPMPNKPPKDKIKAPAPAPKAQQPQAPGKKSVPKGPQAPKAAPKAAPTMLRGKKGGRYYLSSGKKKVYVGK